MRRLHVGILVFGGAVLFGVAIYLVTTSGPDTAAEFQPYAGQPVDQDRREHTDRFFGDESESDLRSGQEMKPRW